LESLRRAIGVVPQETTLFNDSIWGNLHYGRLDATDDEVRHAAELARVSNVVEKLPSGFDTRVGERGLMISGGEKQRIAIARMLLKDPKILFFDEATSSLDSNTETELMRNVNGIMREMDSTSVFIAHRLRTVEDAGLIIVLDNGHVVESGTHAELLRMHGLYQQLWVAQIEKIEQQEKEAADERE